MTISPITQADIPACLAIYNTYIRNTTITFEEAPLTVADFTARVEEILPKYPYLVGKEGEDVLGYAYLAPFNPRSAYRYTADLSIYLNAEQTARGVGSVLYQEIEREAILRGYRMIVSLVTSENTRSARFHEKHGFTLAGELPEVGFKMERWLGVRFYYKRIGTRG